MAQNGSLQRCIGADGITRQDVIIVGVAHVAYDTWMTILQLNHSLSL